MRSPFSRARRDGIDVPIQRVTAVPQMGVHPYGYSEPTEFLNWDETMAKRLDALVKVEAADEGNAAMMDRAIGHEADIARRALTGEHTHHLTFINALIGRRDGDLERLTCVRDEWSAQLPGLEEKVRLARERYEAHTRPDDGVNAQSRREARRTRRAALRKALPEERPGRQPGQESEPA